jgi:beta-galactosidase/beta-glucuronidase
MNQRRTLALSALLSLCAVLVAAQVPVAGLNGAIPVGGWQMQYADKVQAEGSVITGGTFAAEGWYKATVPGTVLTTLVDNHVYPEPLYGENDRANVIPDALSHTPFWYRASLSIPKSYAGRHVWLHFDGINYSAVVWVNGKQVGTVRGAFRRGTFDITEAVRPGATAVLAVLVSPQPHPGEPHEHNLKNGVGKNGGITAMDGPTFLDTIGWDWLQAMRDRDTGIWRKVWLSASGPVVIEDPVVTTDLKVPGFETADVTVKTLLRNVTDKPQEGVLKGTIGGIAFERRVTLPAHSTQPVGFDASTNPALRLQRPKLWWPNGYGPQNLYQLHLTFTTGGTVSQEQELTFGVRKISYTVPSTESLAFVVNGVPIFIRGGDWGMDEAMKRIPVERLDAELRMHKMANMNMVRNWVGQSTSEELFALCDKYGLLVWDEFFQPNPFDGPNPTDFDTYMANVRDVVLRFRNHPSIVLWCARNEGNPPPEIDGAMKTMLAELDPTRLYQANSSDGRSVRSAGPYHWRVPREYFWVNEGFKSETGSISVPTLESIQGMMPRKDWETINDDWAAHDFAKGAAQGDQYPLILTQRYGKIENVADFVRKAQLANFEAYHAMYEGRNALMFHPTTGVLTWMSNPAQPSFVWQLYHYDLEPNASLFAVKSASEMVHVQYNEITGMVQVVNNLPTALQGASVHVQVLNMDGSLGSEQTWPASAGPSSVADAGEVVYHQGLSKVFFVRLRLTDASGKLLSQNFYWLNHPEDADQLTDLAYMPRVELQAKVARTEQDGRSFLSVTLHNPSSHIALMVHLQLRRQADDTRVLPAFYSDNYVSLIGGEDKVVTIECAAAELKGGPAKVVLDGWNATVQPASADGIAIMLNDNAQVDHWPRTGLPVAQN